VNTRGWPDAIQAQSSVTPAISRSKPIPDQITSLPHTTGRQPRNMLSVSAFYTVSQKRPNFATV